MAKTVKPKSPAKKTSGLSDSEQVTELIQGTDHPLKKGMEVLREIILSAHKGITEHIKWKGPSFCFNGDDRVTFNLYKNDCILIVFHRGAKVRESKGKGPLFKDTTGLLEWITNDRATIKLTSLQDINAKKDHLKKVVKQWIIEADK